MIHRLRGWIGQLSALTKRRDAERDMDDEFRFHLEMEADKLERDGWDRDAARSEALRRFGGVQRHKEQVRSARWTGVLEDLASDIRFALRGLLKHLGYSASTVVTLALGMAAALAVFATIDAVLLKPLPYHEPESLVNFNRSMASGFTVDMLDGRLARDAASRLDFMQDVMLYTRIDMVLGQGDEPRPIRVYAASANLFSALRVAPALGRGLLPSDTVGAGARVAVLSHEMWRSMGGDPSVLNSEIELDRAFYRVVGVMPRDFRFPTRYQAQVFVPLGSSTDSMAVAQGRLNMMGRLPAGMSPEQAAERAAVVVDALLADRGDGEQADWKIGAQLVGAWRANRSVENGLWLVAGAVTLMLLVAVVDGVNLLLTQLAGRTRELGVRHALGAGTGRLLRHLLTESLVMATLSGLAAVGLTAWAVSLLNRVAPDPLTILAAHRIELSGRVMTFGFGLTVAVGLAMGLVPALLSVRRARRSAMTSITPYGATTKGRVKLRSSLLVVQVALSMLLLSGAGLLGMSFLKLGQVETGFDSNNLGFLQISLNRRFYPEVAQQRDFADRLEERLEAIPGMSQVTRAWTPLASGFWIDPQLQVEEESEPRADGPMLLPGAYVRPDYLPTVGARLISGRNFLPSENEGSQVAIIDRDLAQFLWGEENPLGRRFKVDAEDPWLTVVGVLDELLLGPPDGSLGEFAFLIAADPNSAVTHFSFRSEVPIAVMLPLVRDAVRQIDPSQPVTRLESAEQALVESKATQWFFVVIVALLAVTALLLAATGLYGVLAIGVTQRRRELGIRLALGARSESLQRMVVRNGVLLAAVGTMLGLVGALAAGTVIESLLFGITPNDPATLALVAAMMLVVALVASLLPARRATKVDPAETLRAE